MATADMPVVLCGARRHWPRRNSFARLVLVAFPGRVHGGPVRSWIGPPLASEESPWREHLLLSWHPYVRWIIWSARHLRVAPVHSASRRDCFGFGRHV